MSHDVRSRLGVFAFMFIMSVLPSAARAQESATSGEQPASPMPAPASPAAPRRATVTATLDVVSAYMFRGIYQEDRGLVTQPLADVGVTMVSGRGALTSMVANLGSWSSVHSGPTSTWYEHDLYAGATLTFGRWKPGALYTSYTSPNDRFNTVHEVAVSLAFDDSASRVPFSPRVLVAFEIDGQADGGSREGTYLEMGVRPTVKVTGGATPLSLAMPVKLGLSLRDYYESALGSDTFGYLDVGLIASVPLPFISGASWDLHGGIDVLVMGRALEALNRGNAVKPVLSIGLGAAF